MYNEGERIIYKKEVCKIVLKDKDGYVLVPIDEDTLKIKVPFSCEGFMRKPIDKEGLDKLIKEVRYISVLENENNMEALYKELLQSGKAEDLIKIIKTTYIRNEERRRNNKKSGDIDLHYFELSEKLLYNEIGVTLLFWL